MNNSQQFAQTSAASAQEKSISVSIDKTLRRKRIAVVVFTFVVVIACSVVLVARFANARVRSSAQPVISSASTEYGTVLPASNADYERTFDADSTIDDDFVTCWCVNTEKKGGAGAAIRYELEQESVISGIRLVNGNLYLPEEELFKRNGQVRNFTLTFSDGTAKSFSARYNDAASCEYQYFHFDKPVSTQFVTLTVVDGYEGEKFPQNVCIAEFGVYRGVPPVAIAPEIPVEQTTLQTPTEDTIATEAETEADAAILFAPDSLDVKKSGFVSYNTPSHAGVNVRNSPAYNSDLLTTLPEGTELLFYPDTVTNEYVYCLFISADGVTDGWIMTAYVEEQSIITEVYKAYLNYLNNTVYFSSGGQTYAEVDDIDGDDVPELLVSGWDDCTIVFAYDSEEKNVYEVVRKEMGKGYNMTAFYSKSLHRVVFPSASTGGEVHEVLEFTPTAAEQFLLLEYENGKHTSAGEHVYKLDGRSIGKVGYDVQLAVLRSTYKKIDTPVERAILNLEDMLKQ